MFVADVVQRSAKRSTDAKCIESQFIQLLVFPEGLRQLLPLILKGGNHERHLCASVSGHAVTATRESDNGMR
jgi:hypothetical protein